MARFNLRDLLRSAARDHAPEPGVPHSAYLDELFLGKSSSDGQPVLYVCQNFACQAPAVGLATIEARLEKLN